MLPLIIFALKVLVEVRVSTAAHCTDLGEVVVTVTLEQRLGLLI